MRYHIAIVINSLKSGGAEKQSILLANSLANEGYSVHYIVLNKKHTVKKLDDLLDRNLCTVVELDGFKLSNIIRAARILKKNNVTHLFAFLTMSTIFSVVVGGVAKTKYIFGSVRNSRLPRIKTVIELFIANYLTTKTIHNSYSGEKHFIEKGMKNTVVIPNCYVNILPEQERNNYGQVKIISVGRFVDQKDYGTALNAINKLREKTSNFEYHIIGWGHLDGFIRETIKNLNLKEFVTVHINPPNVKELLHNSDIYLSTSLFEGTSNSIMEAMDESLPVVATNAGDNKELIEDGKNGFLCNFKDWECISQKLFELCIDSKLRNYMGHNGNRILREKYSESLFRERYISLLNSAEGCNKTCKI
jgi:glycosyltransferase involved in cell wall biosynthesis